MMKLNNLCLAVILVLVSHSISFAQKKTSYQTVKLTDNKTGQSLTIKYSGRKLTNDQYVALMQAVYPARLTDSQTISALDEQQRRAVKALVESAEKKRSLRVLIKVNLLHRPNHTLIKQHKNLMLQTAMTFSHH